MTGATNGTARELVENCRRVTVRWLLDQHGRPAGREPVRLPFRADGTEFVVTLEATALNRGVRWWFVCPRCARRAGTLYSPRSLNEPDFHCRTCWDLGYVSQLA